MNIYDEVMMATKRDGDIFGTFRMVFENEVVNGKRYRYWYQNIHRIQKEISKFDEEFHGKMKEWVLLDILGVRRDITKHVTNDVNVDFPLYTHLVQARDQLNLGVYPCGYEWIEDVDNYVGISVGRRHDWVPVKNALVRALSTKIKARRREMLRTADTHIRFVETLDDQVKDDREIISALRTLLKKYKE